MSEVLIKEFRGSIVENIHRGSIAVVSSTGDTIAYLGDIEKPTFLRSASKPIQVLPTLLAGLHKKFNLTDEEVTMFNSSHWGSSHHIFVLEEIARKTGINPDDMVMKPCSSTSASALASKLTDQSRLHPREGKSRLQHCCSGKHFSLMLLQRELTGSTDGYEKVNSPVQTQIINFLSMLSQTPTFKIGLGTDGCGVPVFALPLRSIAMSYAKLVDPFGVSGELRDAINYNFSCIHAHPEKINDYGTPSYYVNQNPDLIMKDGSRGVICMAIKSLKLGIAVKLEDGWTDEYQGLIIADILEQLGYDAPELIEQLRNCYSTKLYNDCGVEVGHSESDFKLAIDPTFGESPYEDDSYEEDYDAASDSAFADSGDEADDGIDGIDDINDMDGEDDTEDVEDISSAYDIDDTYASGDIDSAAVSDSTIIAPDEREADDSESGDESRVIDATAIFDRRVAEAADRVARAAMEADDDAVIDAIIEKNEITGDENAHAKRHGVKERKGKTENDEKPRRKSLLDMTVVKPSTNRTFISNPFVDPISVKPSQTVLTAEPEETPQEASTSQSELDKSAEGSGIRHENGGLTHGSASVFSPLASASKADTSPNTHNGDNREIKPANIISQKKSGK